MTAIHYTAKRTIAAGHTVDTLYGIDVGMFVVDDASAVERSRHRSISGASETWLHRIDKYITFQTIPIAETDPLLAYIEEFIDSVAAGESFGVDKWGSVAVPSSVQTCELESTKINPTRVQGARYISYQFKVLRV